jgi:hypothetical protein
MPKSTFVVSAKSSGGGKVPMKAKLGRLFLVAVLACQMLAVGCSDDDDEGAGGGAAALATEGTFESGDGALDTVQASLFDNLGEAGVGTPLENFFRHVTHALIFLLEGPDGVIAALASGGSNQEAPFRIGESLTLNLAAFVNELLCAIGSLAGENCEGGSLPPDSSFAALEPDLIALKQAFEDGEGGADLSVVIEHLRRLAEEGLAVSIANLEEQAGNPDGLVPLLEMLRQASLDVADLLDTIQIVGGGDGDELAGADANAAIRVLLENLLVNLFTEVLPLQEQDPETATQLINEIHGAMNELQEALEPLVQAVIDGILDPVTDIIGPILDGILHGLGIEG